MADKKISELTALTGANVSDANDKLAIVDASADETKYITRLELFKSVGGTDFHVDQGNGRLGIGTTSPEASVHVNKSNPIFRVQDKDGTDQWTDFKAQGGAAQIIARNNTSHGTIQLRRLDGTDNLAIMATSNAGDVSFYLDDGTTQGMFWDASAGHVGIGTTSPDSDLHIETSANTSLRLLSGPTSTSYLYMGDTDDAASGRITYYNNSDAMGFRTNGDDRMRIDSSGNVGIGTNNPTEALDVNSDAIRIRTAQTPASASAAGNAGDICWDTNYVYVCVATNTWKRAALSTW